MRLDELHRAMQQPRAEPRVVEVRTYTLKPGLREAFLEIFERRSVPEHLELGMRVLGPYLDLENPDVFVFLRGFDSLEERERLKSAFYDGPLWKDELEAVAMPMIESFTVILTEAAPRLFTFAD